MTYKLLDAVTATGVGNAVEAPGSISGLFGDFLVQASYVDGDAGISAVTLVIEGSLDGTSFFTLDSHAFAAGEITAKAAFYVVTGKLAKFVRANLTTLTGAGAGDSVTVLFHAVLP